MPALVRKEIRDALRHRWLQGYAVVLAGVGLLAAWTAWDGAAGLGLQAFGRTAATLTNFCLLLAPLLALSMGASAIAGERDRGTLDFLLAQPVSRTEVLLGKLVGLGLSAILATFAGFAPAALTVGITAGGEALLRFLLFPALAALLVASLLGVGLLISVESRSAVEAQGRAIVTWFCFVLLYDLLLMGTLIQISMGPRLLAPLLLLNPVDAARVLGVLALEPDLHLLGPAGAFLVEEAGVRGAALLLLLALGAWAVVPASVAVWRFRLGPPLFRFRLPFRWSGLTCERCLARLRS